jgi:hypothetical protein
VLHCRRPQRISHIDTVRIVAETRRWVERAVIGLELCPFAESVYIGNRIRFRVTEARTAAALLEELRSELIHLHVTEAPQCETTLLIHPRTLNDFAEFNDFLEICDAAVAELDLEGELQVASFHPRYQFAGTQPDDIENHTNRSPYPTLHLLRELSVERALAAVPNPESIYENNILRLRALGAAGWRDLWIENPDA